MQAIGRLARFCALAIISCWLLPYLFFSTVGPDEIGVRQSNLSGVSEDDLEPGWALRVPGLHRIIGLPRGYNYLDYTTDEAGHQQPLQIRTRDNNTVVLDVTVPYRIKPGEGWSVVDGFYFAVATLTTSSIADPDLVLEDPWLKVFTAFYVLIGIGIFVAVVGRLGLAFVEVRNEAEAAKQRKHNDADDDASP